MTDRRDDSATPMMKRRLHEPIYRWMSEFVGDKVVVDVGCGDCLGSPLLEPCAKRLIAIDNDSELLQSIDSHLMDKVELLACDCRRAALRDSVADVVVSNALLEYLDEPVAFLREVRRILNDDGLFLCGTKNLACSIRTSRDNSIYANHVCEYTERTLKSLAEEVFHSVEIYGLHLGPRAQRLYMSAPARVLERAMVGLRLKSMLPRELRKSVRRTITGVDLRELSDADFRIGPGSDDAYYLIAKCA